MASALLAFCVAALMQAIVAGQMQTYHALHETRAASLAEAMLDELLSLPYSDLPDWDGFEQAAGEVADVHEALYDTPFQRFRQRVSVTDQTIHVTGLGDVAGRVVTVTVRDDQLGEWTVQRFVRPPGLGLPPSEPGNELPEAS